jgi:GMP synthase (glutamine-hydrolysing)
MYTFNFYLEFDIMFKPDKFIEEKIGWIKNEVGDRKAIVAASGGVDSTVTAVLGHRALGSQLTVIFIDDGLMRAGEPEEVTGRFKQWGLNVELYDMKDMFFSALKGLVDPEEKRKAFRNTFYQAFGDIAKALRAECLLQGTIAADVVETRGGVKTQHNVLEQIGINPVEKWGYKIVEPVKELYKDQVRMVAKALNLPRDIIIRRPFPGPGLAIRVLGEVTQERVEIVRKATQIVEEETRGIPCFQAFAVLLSDRGTGVSKDGKRNYGNIIVIRAVNSIDAMTAKATPIPWRTLKKISNRIVEKVPAVSRVLFDLTDKPPATIEYE